MEVVVSIVLEVRVDEVVEREVVWILVLEEVREAEVVDDR